MATAALISPSTPYYPHHSPFSPAYPPHASQSSHAPAMISPVESTRRTSDDSEAHHRQSLPSIQDIIGPQTTGPPLNQSLPSPFSAPPGAPPPRPYDGPLSAGHEKRPSPRPLHPSPSAFPRPDALPTISDPSRAGGPRPGPAPLHIFSNSQQHPYPHQSPPVKPELQDSEHRHPPPEGPHVNGHGHPAHHPQHAHQVPMTQAPSPYSHPPVPLPYGQLPLSGYPISPRHAGPPLHPPFEHQRPLLGPEAADPRNRQKYDPNMVRHYESWSYAEQLARIGASARTILHFAETYDKLAQEENGPSLPGRLPTEAEIGDTMNQCEWLKGMLEGIRTIVRQTIVDNDRAREGSRTGSIYNDDEDVAMYGAEGSKQNYSIMETKKRRGRPAPPGRCHSCNRIDTPEWRRGPDGARTLCNACGLHYAKLERKRQTESQRSIRPKPSEDR